MNNLVVLLFTLSILFSYVYPQTTYKKEQIDWDVSYWSRVLEGRGEEVGKSVVEDVHGFGVCGKTLSHGSDSSEDILLLKTDKYGTPVWSKVYHQDTDFDAGCMDIGEIVQDETHGLTGYFNRGEPNFRHMFVLETTVHGDIGWIREFYEPGKHMVGHKILTTVETTDVDDVNVVVSGYTQETTEFYKLFIARFGISGDYHYFRQFNKLVYGDHYDMTRTKKMVFLSGTLLEDGRKKPFVIKFDSISGNIEWSSVPSRKTCVLVMELEPHNNTFIFSELDKGDGTLGHAKLVHLGTDEILSMGSITKLYEFADSTGFIMALDVEIKKVGWESSRKRIAFLRIRNDDPANEVFEIDFVRYHDDASDEAGETEESIGFLAPGREGQYVAVGSVYNRTSDTSKIFVTRLDDKGETCFTSDEVSLSGAYVKEYSVNITLFAGGFTESNYTDIVQASFGFVESHDSHGFSGSGDCCIECRAAGDDGCLLVPGVWDDGNDGDDDDDKSWVARGGWALFGIGIPVLFVLIP